MARALLIILIGILALCVGQPALAISELQPVPLGRVISDLYDYSLRIVGLAAFIMFLLAGLAYMFPPIKTSLKIKDPLQLIKDAVIGVILLFSAYLILNSINPDLVGTQPFPQGGNIENR
ncbi:MAG: hypothetical protein IT406_00935 [Candidatus Yanofskybacteria bacterium]|nr:hypothetical protein [Candidatus Yanofskybacteria bacterium]